MSTHTISKHRAVVDTSTGEFYVSSWVYHGTESSPEVPPAADPGFEAVEVSDETLGGLTYSQFTDQKKAVLVGGAFDSWTDRAAAPGLAISANPKADGSNTPDLNITGGPASKTLHVGFSRPVDHNLSGEQLTLDGSGAGSFKFRVHGLGPLTISVSCADCSGASLEVTVDTGTFA